jgi:DegV family protein with EDD domain
MTSVVLVTESTADIPPALAEEFGILVAPASAGFDDRVYADGTLPAAEFYARMRTAAHPPRPFGATERDFRSAFEEGLRRAESVVALLMPYDVSATFTTASAAMLSMDEGAPIKIVNPGVASAGLGALVLSLAQAVCDGMDRDSVLDFVEDQGPDCDTVFVPETVEWLGRAGKLELIQQKLGEVEDARLLVRIGTRIAGIALADDDGAAFEQAVALAARRIAPAVRVVVTIDDAVAADRADVLEQIARERLNVARLVRTELSSTIGSQLGPGTVGIGVALVAGNRGSDA